MVKEARYTSPLVRQVVDDLTHEGELDSELDEEWDQADDEDEYIAEVNGAPVRGPRKLRSGDVIEIGYGHKFEFRR